MSLNSGILSFLTLSALIATTLFGFDFAARRASNRVLWVLFLFVPIGLTPTWLASHSWGFFEWGKLYTIIGTACVVVWFRGSQNRRYHWSGKILLYLFALNISEAILVDLQAGTPAGLINGFAGFVLILNLPKVGPQIIVNRHVSDVLFPGFNRLWIVSFTVWNLTFLHNHYPVIFGHHLVVLGVPLAIGLRNTERWLQARIWLLAVDLMVLATFRSRIVPFLDTTHWYSPRVDVWAAGLSLALSVIAYLSTKLTRTAELELSDSKSFRNNCESL